MPDEPGASPAAKLRLDDAARESLWQQVAQAVEEYFRRVDSTPVAPRLDPTSLRAELGRFDFSQPVAPAEAVQFAVDHLWQDQVHTAHRGYYGLFNPAPTAMGVAADALVAAFNPQLAAWSHNPFAAEVERHLVLAMAERFGYRRGAADGLLTSGGMEANHTALLSALVDKFPGYARDGVRSAPGRPVLYVSAEGHDSLTKAARLTGLGSEAARAVPTDSGYRLDVAALRDQMARDRSVGCIPFLLVATAGTTGSGAIDPCRELAQLAAAEGLWLHVDAAWGGAAMLVPELRPALAGIELADSITFDAHKWLSVPMAAGMYLTRHLDVLVRAFRVEQRYMPREAAHLDVIDPFSRGIPWSRRFIGLKLFLSLAVAGWDGYRDVVRAMTALGDELRRRLNADGWRVVNDTPLPLVCFVDGTRADGGDGAYLDAICARVIASGQAWLSVPRLDRGAAALRVCVTSYRTTSSDLQRLLAALGRARREVGR